MAGSRDTNTCSRQVCASGKRQRPSTKSVGSRLSSNTLKAVRGLPGGQLAYRLDARFDEAPPRIGLRGTAKLFGERAPLALYLLRRPLAGLRQSVGL